MNIINSIFTWTLTWTLAIGGSAGLVSLGSIFASWLAVETLVLLVTMTA